MKKFGESKELLHLQGLRSISKLMSTKVNLVHFSAGPGGMEILLPEIVESFPKISFKAFVIRPVPEERSVYENTNVEISYGHKQNLIAVFRLFFYVLKNRKEIFHVFNIGPLFLLAMKMGGAKKIIYSIHGTIYWKNPFKKRILHFLWQLALSDEYRFTANSEYSKSVFLKKVSPRQKIQVIYNSIDGNRFSPQVRLRDSDHILIVYTGRLNEGKNLAKWIDIAFDIHSKLPETRFEIYGQGPLETMLRNKIRGINAENYISLMGFHKDIENIYRRADLLLFLSEYESFGNVVVECILCGTPVLVSPLPAMKEIFKEFPQFVIGEEKDWNKQVYEGLLDLSELKKLSLTARSNFLKRFDFESNLNLLANIYDEFE
jgi:glycosyltransferase involved in cell wall biosynthesis